LPDEQEIKIGERLEKSYGFLWRDEDEEQSRAIQAYVNQVGARLAAHAHRKLPYRFHYVSSLDFINAFALPGGPVIIGGGLMAQMRTEDELAAVLGHEIEHIDHYHCAERVQVEDAIRHTPLGAVVALPVAVLMAGYSKDQEFQADREGVKLAAAVSYSPQRAIRVFEAFERLFPAAQTPRRSPPEGLSDAALKTLEGYFQSHPPSAERIDQIRKMIASGQLPNWTRTTPLPVEFYFLTERSFRALGRAELPMRGGLSNKDRKTWQAERDEYYRQAGTLAAQSLALRSDQPRALSILAVASYGLGDFAAGAATYHKLLPDYPAFADSIRQHLEALARQALAVENYAKAASLASHALDLQPDQDSLLKTLAEAQFGLKDFTGASETCRKLKALYPSAADAVRSAADTLADAALARHEYRDAASLAAQSLELKPGQLRMLRILAQAEFAQANFAPAAVAYRKVLDQQIWDLDWVRGYADALSVLLALAHSRIGSTKFT